MNKDLNNLPENLIYDFDETPEESEEERKKNQFWQTVKRFVLGLVALVTLFGFLYMSTLHYAFFFQRTSPTSSHSVLKSLIEGEEVSIPLIYIILQGEQGSLRSDIDVEQLTKNASNIWNQGKISFYVKEVNEAGFSSEDEKLLFENPYRFFLNMEKDKDSITVLLTRHLYGINGIALTGSGVVAVADYTSSADHRVLAHEIGHILGLGHVKSKKRLMSQGVSGVELLVEEIEIARHRAKNFFEN